MSGELKLLVVISTINPRCEERLDMLVLMCRAGEHRFALDSEVVAEVVPYVELRSMSGAPDWMAGVFAYRGQVLSVLDLVQAATGSRCPVRWSSRIVIVRLPGADQQLLGLLTEHVTTTQWSGEPLQNEAPSNHQSVEQKREHSRSEWNWGAVRLDEEGMFRVLDLEQLVTSERRAMLA